VTTAPEVHLSIQGSHDLAGQIYRQLRGAMADGRLAAGERLPSTRELALQLGVSRKTTLEAFDRLTAEGYLSARQGDGSFVNEGLLRLTEAQPLSMVSRLTTAPVWDCLPEALAMPAPVPVLPIDFRGGAIDKAAFPLDAWRRDILYALRANARGVSSYRDPAGEQELRLAISRYLAVSRAVVCQWREVIVTQGAQQALDLIARAMIRAGDVVAMEEPGYPPARACFAAAGAHVIGVPVDREGLLVEQLPAGARVVYITPSHQFPLGMPMSLPRRAALLQWAQRHAALIVEDDYDGEYRFEGRPLDALKSLDQADTVAYVGTFSKTIFPELRMGYMVPPGLLHPVLCKARQTVDWHGCTMTQTALAKFMLDGDFARHLRRMQKRYAGRRTLLLKHLRGPLAHWLEPLESVAGIHMAARIKAPLGEAELIDAAAKIGIGLYGLAPFHSRIGSRPGLLFGYGATELDHIERGLTGLAQLLPTLG
jgi:GntR family transcriptional regulator / MocR family aminotransferase